MTEVPQPIQHGHRKLVLWLAMLLQCCLVTPAHADADESAWPSAGQNLENTRYQKLVGGISVQSAPRLAVKWQFTTGGDVSATPAVDASRVYFPDWTGNLYAVDRKTGQQVWRTSISAASGVPFDKARATPVVAGNKLIVGTQGSILVPGGGPGGKLIAFDKNTGAVLWVTSLESHPATIVTQSAVVYEGRVYVGVASQEEALAGLVPGYPCCAFRASMLALDVETGNVLWKTYMVPAGYSGGAVWGSAPAVDVKRRQLYIATGNNYSVPASVLACVAAAGENPDAQRACIAPDDYFDSIVALDLVTGAVRWRTAALPYDAWTVSCIPFLGDGSNCPNPAGPDYDFGQGPALYKASKEGTFGKEYVGAGQKSGQYWALDPDTGAVRWVTQAGPGGTAGGLQWGSAVDGQRVYTANANSNLKPWLLPNGRTSLQGIWSALDASTGQLLWQIEPPTGVGGGASGPVTTTNGVVFGCTLDALGHMYAMNAATGAVLWTFASGGSCLSGAAIAAGNIYWGSGYSNFGFGTPNNKLYAFEVR
jgi:polyvinyl alcohol dehydrogenase (cytochrome)